MFKYDPKKYLAFVLDEESRNLLISEFPFVYEKQYCHHITLFFNGKEEQFKEVLKSLKSEEQEVFVNWIIDSDGVQCFVVEFNETYERFFGGTFHITHSIRKDRKPVDSNITIKQVLVPNSGNKEKINTTNNIKITGKVEYLDK